MSALSDVPLFAFERAVVTRPPFGIDEPIHLHFSVGADEVERLLADPEFVARARRLLHESHGHCRDGRVESCYDTYHRPHIDTYQFIRHLFGIEP